VARPPIRFAIMVVVVAASVTALGGPFPDSASLETQAWLGTPWLNGELPCTAGWSDSDLPRADRPGPEPDAVPILYPNPCGTNGTDIQFVVRQRGSIEVALYSTAGNLVRTLVQSPAEDPGIRQVTWDGRDNMGRGAATGTYLCRILTGNTLRIVEVTKSR